MRMLGKPDQGEREIPWIGTIELLKDARITRTSGGAVFWNAFGAYKKARQKGEESKAIGLSAGIPVSRFLHEWKKGTILFVAGKVVDDEFQTRQQGKPVFKIQVEFCIEQPDYYTMYNVAPQLSSYEKSSSAPRDEFQGYIPPPTF